MVRLPFNHDRLTSDHLEAEAIYYPPTHREDRTRSPGPSIPAANQDHRWPSHNDGVLTLQEDWTGSPGPSITVANQDHRWPSHAQGALQMQYDEYVGAGSPKVGSRLHYSVQFWPTALTLASQADTEPPKIHSCKFCPRSFARVHDCLRE